MNASGDLEVVLPDGVIRQGKPYVYQDISGSRVEIAGGFVIEAQNRSDKSDGPFYYHFDVASHDPAYPLIIDPGLVFSSYLGGTNGHDGPFAFGSEGGIAVDKDGNVYVTGQAGSTDFPATVGAVNIAPLDGSNVFVSKFSPDGSTLIYSAVFGGSSTDSAQDIKVDASGNAYVAGATTSNNFPTMTGAFDRTYNAGPGTRWDMFVAKLNANGTALLYSTYFGGTLDDGGNNFDAAMATRHRTRLFRVIPCYYAQSVPVRRMVVSIMCIFRRPMDRAAFVKAVLLSAFRMTERILLSTTDRCLIRLTRELPVSILTVRSLRSTLRAMLKVSAYILVKRCHRPAWLMAHAPVRRVSETC